MSKEPAHVRQALNELENTVNEEQQRAARKRLAAAGITEGKDDGKDDPHKRAPQGRQAPGKQTS